MPHKINLAVQSNPHIPCFSGETKNARYMGVHGIWGDVLHVNTTKHGIWGKNTVHGISGARYIGARYKGV